MAVGLGQVLSILICGTAVTSGLLQQQNVIIPTGMLLYNLTIHIYHWLDMLLAILFANVAIACWVSIKFSGYIANVKLSNS